MKKSFTWFLSLIALFFVLIWPCDAEAERGWIEPAEKYYFEVGQGLIAPEENSIERKALYYQFDADIDIIEFSLETENPICYDGNAKIIVNNVTGGTGNYLYSFDGGATWNENNSYEWIAPYEQITVGVRSVEDDIGATYKDADPVVNPSKLSVFISDYFPPKCADGSDGNITIQIEGGTEPYDYSINNGDVREIKKNSVTFKVGVGDFEIFVIDASGCISETITKKVEQQENIIEASANSGKICAGEKSGSIAISFKSWADGLDAQEKPIRGEVKYYVGKELESEKMNEFNPAVDRFEAGVYFVKVVDQYECESNIEEIVISESPELIIDNVVIDGGACYGAYDGTIIVNATGGNVTEAEKLKYAFVNNEGALSELEEWDWLYFDNYNINTTESNVTFKVKQGEYWLAVKDLCGDIKTYGPVNVPGYDELLVDESKIVVGKLMCSDNENGSISIPMDAVTGGAGGYKFTLFKVVGEDNTLVEVEGYVNRDNGEFKDISSGIYAVRVEDKKGCPSYTTGNIILKKPAELKFLSKVKHFSCAESNDGKINITVEGGTPPYYYAINNYGSWRSFPEESVDNVTFIAAKSMQYTIWVKDANDCEAEAQVVDVLKPMPLNAEISIDKNVTCYKGNDGQVTVIGKGGWENITKDFQFKVDNGGWSEVVSSPLIIDTLRAGEHILSVADVTQYSDPVYQKLNCIYEVPFIIGEPEPIMYNVDVSDVKCKGESGGILTVEIVGGGLPFVDENGENDGYKVRLVNSEYDSGEVFTGKDNIYIFYGLAPSSYSLEIQDANGCSLPIGEEDDEAPYSTKKAWVISEPDTYLALNVEVTKDMSTCYGSNDGSFIVNAEGGVPPYKYYAAILETDEGELLSPLPPDLESDLWKDNKEFDVGAGIWGVWVMDDNGCIIGGKEDNQGNPVDEWRAIINQPEKIEWSFVETDQQDLMPDCYGSWNGKIVIGEITGGEGKYSASVVGISAQGNEVKLEYENILPVNGIYSLEGIPASDKNGFNVFVTDEIGCSSDIKIINIEQPDELVVTVDKADGEFTCAGAVEGFIDAKVKGGLPPYEYQLLKNGEVFSDWESISLFYAEIENSFTVNVRDQNGCQADATIFVEPTKEVEIVSVEDRSCYNEPTPSAVISAVAEEGRNLFMRYKKVDSNSENNEWSDWVDFNMEEGAGTHKIDEGLTFGNENEYDGHYEFQVMDEMGCMSKTKVKTFVPVQTELNVDATVEGNTLTVLATGGAVGPDQQQRYQYAIIKLGENIDLAWRDENVIMLEEYGEYVVFVHDYNWCSKTVTVKGGYEVKTIAEVQGKTESSPEIGNRVGITGTITGIVRGEGFYLQDNNGSWNGIWVAYSGDNDLIIGEGVSVVGAVIEKDEVTTIIPNIINPANALEITPVILESPLLADNEMYESVLVKIEGGRADEANDKSEWKLYYEEDDNIIVNPSIYAYEPTKGNFYNVTGIVKGFENKFTIGPRFDDDIVDVTQVTGIEEVGLDEFIIYPNPFEEFIKVDNYQKVERLTISNIAGQIVVDEKYPDHVISTSDLVSGMYIVNIFTCEGLAKTERIIKK